MLEKSLITYFYMTSKTEIVQDKFRRDYISSNFADIFLRQIDSDILL